MGHTQLPEPTHAHSSVLWSRMFMRLPHPPPHGSVTQSLHPSPHGAGSPPATASPAHPTLPLQPAPGPGACSGTDGSVTQADLGGQGTGDLDCYSPSHTLHYPPPRLPATAPWLGHRDLHSPSNPNSHQASPCPRSVCPRIAQQLCWPWGLGSWDGGRGQASEKAHPPRDAQRGPRGRRGG